MNKELVQELYRRRAVFAPRDAKPFSGSHPTNVVVVLSFEEAEELKRLSFDRETQELSEKRCNACSVGQIVKEKVASTKWGKKLRYSCVCDGSPPINPDDWMPVAEKDKS